MDQLEDILERVKYKASQDSDHHYRDPDLSEEAKSIDELLEDLIDLAREKGAEGLTSKLASFAKKDTDYRFIERPKASELEARIYRIQRAVRAFGGGLVSEMPVAIPDSVQREKGAVHSEKVFVVHGHDEAVLHEVSRFLEKLKLKPIVLREQPNRGKTIIEKFEANSDVGFAVVLMTKDDMGASIDDAESERYQPRARQNVILELGYFIGHLRRDRVCVLKEKGIEEPSDIFGVVYHEINVGGAWKLQLGKELKAAGYNVDLNLL
jgi:hypothetical protein